MDKRSKVLARGVAYVASLSDENDRLLAELLKRRSKRGGLAMTSSILSVLFDPTHTGPDEKEIHVWIRRGLLGRGRNFVCSFILPSPLRAEYDARLEEGIAATIAALQATA